MSSPIKRTNPPNWLDLPPELWPAISKKLSSSVGDYLAFRGVCRPWRTAATFENFDSATPRVPWLMYISNEKSPRNKFGDRFVKLLDLSTRKSHKMTNFSPFDAKSHLSCRGWILCVSSGNGEVYLAHPVWAEAKIELPGLSTLPRDDDGRGFDRDFERLFRFIMKMVLSGSPTTKTGDFVVMVIWGSLSNRLAFSRPGDKSWTLIEGGDSFTDIIYYNRKLYAVDSKGMVVECDVHGPNPTQVRQVFNLPEAADRVDAPPLLVDDVALLNCEKTFYLVESCGKIAILIRYTHLRKTMWFEAFEIELTDGSHKKMDNWNKALFVGFNSSVCVGLSDWDVVRPNCIYFTDDHGRNSKDLEMGVFCLSRLERTTTCLLGMTKDVTFLSPFTWVMPSF